MVLHRDSKYAAGKAHTLADCSMHKIISISNKFVFSNKRIILSHQRSPEADNYPEFNSVGESVLNNCLVNASINGTADLTFNSLGIHIAMFFRRFSMLVAIMI